jgi:subtilisin family serine protease
MRRRRPIGIVAVLLVAASVLVTAAPASADSIRARECWLSDYGITNAWKVTKGAGVTVAVIDTGIGTDVSDLGNAVTGGTDFSGLGSTNGRTPVGTTDSAHGTMVATMLAARGHGTSGGIIGVAPEANLLSISIGFGTDTADSDDQVADAVRWAVDHGASVINMSLTRNTQDWPTSWDTAFLYAMQHNVVVVAAAGNRSNGTTEVGAPATMPGVLTVAGLTQSGTASESSSSQGITIGVAAPAEKLVGQQPGGSYVLWGGTSGATPIVAGVVALVRAAHPTLDAADVINRITSTATPAGAAGVDPIYGFGKLNASAAVSAKVTHVDANPMGDLSDWIRVHRRAEVTAAPTTTATASPVPSSIAEPTGSAASARTDSTTAESLGIPLTLFAAFGIALLVLLVALGRFVRRAKRKG